MKKSLQNKEPTRNLVGKKFNMLTVVSFSHFSEKGYPYWNCLCDCGNEKVIGEHNLRNGRTKSCGCLKSLKGKNVAIEKFEYIDGVNIKKTMAQTQYKNNTSGFRGVHQRKDSSTWRAMITFKGKRYNLGSFSNFEEAVEARLKGEKIIEEFLDNYLKNI